MEQQRARHCLVLLRLFGQRLRNKRDTMLRMPELMTPSIHPTDPVLDGILNLAPAVQTV